MNKHLVKLCLASLFLASSSALADTLEECYENICASITLPEFVEIGSPFELQVSGRLISGFEITTFQVLQDVDWSYTPSHKVQIDSAPTPAQKLASSGFNFGPVNRSISVVAEPGRRFTFVFGLGLAHGSYDVAVEAVINSAESSTAIAIDIKPGSCINPFNVNKNGVLPVAILGSPELDVRTLDVESIRLVGVAPIRHSLEDVSSTALDITSGAAITVCDSGSDGYQDLTLKFDAQEIAAAIESIVAPRDLEDGETITLPLQASKPGSTATDFEGSDNVRIILKGSKR